MSIQLIDQNMNVIFGQLELLSELAQKAGDAELAIGLTALLAVSLERYCNQKRDQLATNLPAPGAETKAA